jgi:DNA repair exonuclease SbcCD ATPase subunit
MQELKAEMKNRIKTLERSIERCEAERERLLTQCTQVDEQIKEEKTLVEQYRDALRRLSSIGLHPDPVVVVRMPDAVGQVEAEGIHRALTAYAKANGSPLMR